jgi:predicted ferric reductase
MAQGKNEHESLEADHDVTTGHHRRARHTRVLRRSSLFVAVVLASMPSVLWLVAASEQAFWSALSATSAWVAVGSLAISMLLMVRLRWLDIAFGGLARMYRYHHAFGVAAFVAALIHPLALAARSLTSGSARTALQLLWPNPDAAPILSGWIALLTWMIWMISTVSVKLPYRAWRLMHRSGGVLFPLLAWHFAAVATAAPAWVFGVMLFAASMLGYVYRVGFEDRATHGRRYRIVEVTRRTPAVIELVLAPLADALRFESGQFVYVALLDSPNFRACGEMHPYTPTSDPSDPNLRLSIKASGDCTRHIQEVSVGAEAIVQGPFGGLFPERAAQHGQVWVGGGLGIAAFMSRAACLRAEDGVVDLVYAVPTSGAELYLEPLRNLERMHPNLRVHMSFDDRDGLLTCERITARVGSLAQRDIVIAGPPAMIHALEKSLHECGVPASSIHTERGVLQ